MSAKDKFVYDVLEKYRDKQWTYYQGYNKKSEPSDYDTDKVELFENVYLTKGDLESLEHNIQTLEQWFSSQKEKPFKE